MKVGIFCIQPDMDANPARVAAHAEALGFNSYWAPDHIILPAKYETKYPGNSGDGPDPDYLWKMPDPLIALMHAATATTTLQIGTAVFAENPEAEQQVQTGLPPCSINGFD